MHLTDLKCSPCSGDTPKLAGATLRSYMEQVPGWDVTDSQYLRRTYKFKDFKSALAFVNQVGAVAEEQGHHPNIDFTWGQVSITIFTHAIQGLSESDFILAAHISQI